MRRLRTACLMFVVFSVLVGVIYPLVMTGVAQLLFPRRANGSLLSANGGVVGSELLGQAFDSPAYFHGRPSDCGYDAAASSSSNFGPSNPALFGLVRNRIDSIQTENGMDSTSSVPADLALASASGLDPDINPQSAALQVVRVAHARGLEVAEVRQLAARLTQKSFLGVFGQPRINVLKLNLALDSISAGRAR